MIEFIKNWVLDIIIVIFFIAFVEIILPTSNMRKYINVVLGLLVIIVLINPIINIISKDIDIGKEVFLNINNYNKFSASDDYNFIDVQNDQMANLYKDILANDIEELIEIGDKYNIVKIDIYIEEDINKDNYGEIYGVKLYLKRNDGVNDESNKVEVVKVEDIKINLESPNIRQDDNFNLPEMEYIRELISTQYKIKKDSIIVKLEP